MEERFPPLAPVDGLPWIHPSSTLKVNVGQSHFFCLSIKTQLAGSGLGKAWKVRCEVGAFIIHPGRT